MYTNLEDKKLEEAGKLAPFCKALVSHHVNQESLSLSLSLLLFWSFKNSISILHLNYVLFLMSFISIAETTETFLIS